MIRPLILLAATLALTWPLLAFGAPLETYHRQEDGQDYAPAFDRAQDAGAIQVELAARAYPVSRPIDVCSPLAIVGVGPGMEVNSSQITTRRITAIRTWHVGKCPRATAPKGKAGHLLLDRVALWNQDVRREAIPGEPPFYGLDGRTRVRLVGVSIYSFVQGIRLVCHSQEGANCNTSSVSDVDVFSSQHSGVHVEGDCSNASVFSRVNTKGSCVFGAHWAPMLASGKAGKNPRNGCAGAFDGSFLGNVWVASHNASEGGFAGFVAVGDSNASTLIGPYLEQDSWPGFVGARVTVIGGLNQFAGPGGQYKGAEVSGLTVRNGDVRLDLGQQTNVPNTVWTITAPPMGAWPFRMKVHSSGGLFMDVGNSRQVGAIPWQRP